MLPLFSVVGDVEGKAKGRTETEHLKVTLSVWSLVRQFVLMHCNTKGLPSSILYFPNGLILENVILNTISIKTLLKLVFSNVVYTSDN